MNNDELRVLNQYSGTNPFVDNNGRDLSDYRIQEDFYPTNQFWSLFNNRHEILLGTRGSGKTFLLKMMRRSMLSRMDYPQTKDLLDSKQYISFYLALQLERMSAVDGLKVSNEEKTKFFYLVFNSCLAISIISEAKQYCLELNDYSKNMNLARKLYSIWFKKNADNNVFDLDDLEIQVNNLFAFFDPCVGYADIPHLFISELCAPLVCARETLAHFWNADSPTWILAIDEAEFVKPFYQKIINTRMRSNSNQIIFKIGTLPYHWSTLETLHAGVKISSENDFKYSIVNLDCDGEDFRKLTNKLCSSRLNSIVLADGSSIHINSLEDFLGKIGSDKRLDYFKNEMEGVSDESIRDGIIKSLSEERKKSQSPNSDNSKTIMNKFAPIYYVREVLKKKKKYGKYIPQWFAGSEVVRRVSQGNPRLFLSLMRQLFNCIVSKGELSLKDQNRIITDFARNICLSSKAIDKSGGEIYKNLTFIANLLSSKTHDGPILEVGCSFVLNFKHGFDLNEAEKWIKQAISFSRLIVDNSTLINGLKPSTKYTLCNSFAVEYWLTMRSDYPVTVTIDNSSSSLDENVIEDDSPYQFSFFSED